jgi:formate dehydrogenase subunit beta
MQEITDNIREQARELFADERVDVIIGYQQGWDEQIVTPCFVTDELQVDKLIWNEHCTHNLAKYLVGREGYLTSRFRSRDDKPRVALVATPAAMRTIAGLIQEHQFKREDLFVLGIVDRTQKNIPGIQPDIEVGQAEANSSPQDTVEDVDAQIAKLEAMSPAERRAFWEREFAKCIRCYACRQVCPFCYCEECIADENQPQWIGKSPTVQNNTSWNVIRAFHLVGRCIDCAECDRVCPVNIPLRLLNRKMIAEVEEAFDYVAGKNTDVEPALVTFSTSDRDDNIR